jgi:hypothetical protein
MSAVLIEEVEGESDSDVLSNDDEIDPDYILSELYRRVFLYNTKEAKKLARKKSVTLIYKVG